MKNQVNFVYDFDDDPADELKHWLFLENVKLNQQKQQLEFDLEELQKERAKFEREKQLLEREYENKDRKIAREKELFEKQWKIVEQELVRMARDRERIVKEKAYIQREKDELKRLRQTASSDLNTKSSMFFVGVSNLAGLRKRYRDLMKIYHPDNECGDENTVLYINREYEKLKTRFER